MNKLGLNKDFDYVQMNLDDLGEFKYQSLNLFIVCIWDFFCQVTFTMILTKQDFEIYMTASLESLAI